MQSQDLTDDVIREALKTETGQRFLAKCIKVAGRYQDQVKNQIWKVIDEYVRNPSDNEQIKRNIEQFINE